MSSTYTKLRYHLLFSTRTLQPLIKEEVRGQLYRYIGGIINRQRGSLLEIGGQPDHVHLLVTMRPNLAVADLVRLIKANSARRFNSPEKPFSWQRGYASFTVSESQVERVRKYIRDQDVHHRKSSSTDEFEQLLTRHRLNTVASLAESRQHTFTRLRHHIIFGTKQRLSLIAPDLQPGLYQLTHKIVEGERSDLLEIGGIADHVHLLLEIRPNLSVSGLLRTIKANTSAWMNERGGLETPFGWQRGYSAFSVSESQVPQVRRYIERQEEHHQTMSFAEESHRLIE